MLDRGDDRFFTHALTDRSVCHEVRRNLGLLSWLGLDPLEDRLEIWLSDDDELFADRILTATWPKPVAAIGPGAGDPKRMWPIQRFVEVARWLANNGFAIVVVGGQGEEALGEELRRHVSSKVIDLTGKATLRQSAAVLRHCVLFCGNDAGPMHLAAVAGIPVVEVSCHPLSGDALHPNSPTRFSPWGVPIRVIRPDRPVEGCAKGCRALSPHCITRIPEASVIAAIASLLDEKAASGWSADAS
jgi:heptosyltransferase-2